MRTFEDFTVGKTETFGDYLVTEEEIIEFAQKYDPQPFHTDPVFAKNAFHGQLISSGWMTCSIMMRLLCDHVLTQSHSIGSPGVERLRWIRPVHGGDNLKVTTECTSARRSKSNPDLGIIQYAIKVSNQKDEAVLKLSTTVMLLTRAAVKNQKTSHQN